MSISNTRESIGISRSRRNEIHPSKTLEIQVWLLGYLLGLFGVDLLLFNQRYILTLFLKGPRETDYCVNGFLLDYFNSGDRIYLVSLLDLCVFHQIDFF